MTGNRPRVAVVFGGRSSEHAISCVSAASILASLDPEAYEVVAVGITRSGSWVLADPDPDRLQIRDGVLPEVIELPGTELAASDAHHAQQALPAVLGDIDVVFPVLHGPWGEDGTLQGLLDFAGVPYVGSGVFASAAAMDKGHMRALFKAAQLPQTDYEVVTDFQWRRARDAAMHRLDRLDLPLFVKPARAGSSLGVVRVTSRDEVVDAIEVARTHDPRVIVEAAVTGAREIECGVLTDIDGSIRASGCAEIALHPGRAFYDFEAKYLDDAADLIVPADLPMATAQTVRTLALQAFEALACEGLARVDMFVQPDGSVLMNEVNTMPGFTPISMFPRVWAASGLDFSALVDHLVRDALRRGTGLR